MDPTVYRVTPAAASPGAKVHITGRNFAVEPGTVTFRDQPLEIVKWSSTSIRARLPDGVTGLDKIRVTSSDGRTSRSGGCVEVGLGAVPVGETLLARAFVPSAQIDKHVWMFGGYVEWGGTGNVERYTLGSNTSVTEARWHMPVPVANTGAAAIGSRIYIPGGDADQSGHDNNLTDALQIFDTSRAFDDVNPWSLGPSMPEPIMGAAVVAHDRKVYVFGGLTRIGEEWSRSDKTYIYDPSTQRWTTGPPMPAARALPTAVSLSSSQPIRVLGGFARSGYCGDESRNDYSYDPISGTWTVNGSRLTQPRGGAAGLVHDGAIYVMNGGCLALGMRSGERNRGDRWSADLLGRSPLHTPVAGAAGKYLYLMNGRDSSDWSYPRTVWRFRVRE
jgi:hypothetical protein